MHILTSRKKAGEILKYVLEDNTITFETRKGLVREYQLIATNN